MEASGKLTVPLCIDVLRGTPDGQMIFGVLFFLIDFEEFFSNFQF